MTSCDQRKLWRNEIATRKRMACRCELDRVCRNVPGTFRLNKTEKSDILFNLKTSGGLSGVRKQSEVFK